MDPCETVGERFDALRLLRDLEEWVGSHGTSGISRIWDGTGFGRLEQEFRVRLQMMFGLVLRELFGTRDAWEFIGERFHASLKELEVWAESQGTCEQPTVWDGMSFVRVAQEFLKRMQEMCKVLFLHTREFTDEATVQAEGRLCLVVFQLDGSGQDSKSVGYASTNMELRCSRILSLGRLCELHVKPATIDGIRRITAGNRVLGNEKSSCICMKAVDSEIWVERL